MLYNSRLLSAIAESKIYAKEFGTIPEAARSDIAPVFVYLQSLHTP